MAKQVQVVVKSMPCYGMQTWWIFANLVTNMHMQIGLESNMPACDVGIINM